MLDVEDMNDFDPNEPWVLEALLTHKKISDELHSLQGKNDPASEERRLELIDELMTVDMALKPMREAMRRGGKDRCD